ncbi:MAG: hypothetical protein ACP5N3_06370 [Candidatus Nanoarchaeia archaeon]
MKNKFYLYGIVLIMMFFAVSFAAADYVRNNHTYNDYCVDSDPNGDTRYYTDSNFTQPIYPGGYGGNSTLKGNVSGLFRQNGAACNFGKNRLILPPELQCGLPGGTPFVVQDFCRNTTRIFNSGAGPQQYWVGSYYQGAFLNQQACYGCYGGDCEGLGAFIFEGDYMRGNPHTDLNYVETFDPYRDWWYGDYNCEWGCVDGTCATLGNPSANSCTDEDNNWAADGDMGVNPYVFSRVFGLINGESYSYKDSCTDSQLTEYSCDGNVPTSTVINCQYGCIRNTCALADGSQKVHDCNDYDGGIDINVNSHVLIKNVFPRYQESTPINSTNMVKIRDFCSNASRLSESTCASYDLTSIANKAVACPYGCGYPEGEENGARCLNEGEIATYVCADSDGNQGWEPSLFVKGTTKGVPMFARVFDFTAYRMNHPEMMDDTYYYIGNAHNPNNARNPVIFVNGEAKVVGNPNAKTFEDTCVQKFTWTGSSSVPGECDANRHCTRYVESSFGSRLTEFSCENMGEVGNLMNQTILTCEWGCRNATCLTYENRVKDSCFDNDSGINTLVRGKVTGVLDLDPFGYMGHGYQDVCYGQDTHERPEGTLKEYYCEDTGDGEAVWRSIDISCEWGCSEGRCLGYENRTQEPCTESDGGMNIFVPGTAVYNYGGNYTLMSDSCEDSEQNILLEYTCEYNPVSGMTSIVEHEVDCAAEAGTTCQMGRCVNESVPLNDSMNKIFWKAGVYPMFLRPDETWISMENFVSGSGNKHNLMFGRYGAGSNGNDGGALAVCRLAYPNTAWVERGPNMTVNGVYGGIYYCRTDLGPALRVFTKANTFGKISYFRIAYSSQRGYLEIGAPTFLGGTGSIPNSKIDSLTDACMYSGLINTVALQVYATELPGNMLSAVQTYTCVIDDTKICNDTDGGNLGEIFGTATGWVQSPRTGADFVYTTRADYCRSGSTRYLNEQSCEGLKVKNTQLDGKGTGTLTSPQFTCSNGAFIPYAPTICTENDGGNKPFVPGTVMKGSTYNDACSNATRLREYYCSSNNLREQYYTCALCQDGACAADVCTDSDGGDVSSIKGTVLKGISTYVDSCSNATSLKEYYCENGNNNKLNYYDCNCQNGACVNPAGCFDTDGGYSLFIKGTVTKADITNPDVCVNTTRLREYYCENGNIAFRPTDCSCSGDICTSAPEGTWTSWYNIDTPEGTGDWESRTQIQGICADGSNPDDIECATVGTSTAPSTGWQNTGQVYTCALESGGACNNAQQQPGSICLDYKVRFRCPAAKRGLNG